MLFDPVRRKETAMIDFLVNTVYDPNRPMGNVSLNSINMLLGDWMVGLKSETQVILPSRIEWLQQAIDNNEKLPRSGGEDNSFHIYSMHEYLALAKWLYTGKDSLIDWKQARKISINHYNDWHEKRKIRTDGLNDYLATCILAEEYQAGIDEYEHHYGQKKISTKRKTITPRDYGYLVCQNKLNPVHDNQTMLELGRKLLVANLEDYPWLGYGQFKTATIWLKIVYSFNEQHLTPEQTLLKIYDNMPNVEKPDFIPSY